MQVNYILLYYICNIATSNNNNQQPKTIIMRHYYALSDICTSPNPKEPTSGFADDTIAIAFCSVRARTAWLAATKLLKARAITRPEALKLTPPLLPDGMKRIPVWNTDAAGRAVDTGWVVTLRESIYQQDFSI